MLANYVFKIFNVNFYGKKQPYNGAFKVAMVSDHGNRNYVLDEVFNNNVIIRSF